jgi:HSP20 family protein
MSNDRWSFHRGNAPYRPIPELEELRRRFEEDIAGPLRRASPFRTSPEMADMRRKFEEDFIRPVTDAIYGRIPDEQKAWAPPVDIFEKDDNLIVKVELPGIKQEDMDVSVMEDHLIIKAEKKAESDIKDEDVLRGEISYGKYQRSVPLPAGLNTKSMEAVLEDGILRVIMKKLAGEKAKKVTVQVKKGSSAS